MWEEGSGKRNWASDETVQVLCRDGGWGGVEGVVEVWAANSDNTADGQEGALGLGLDARHGTRNRCQP